MAALQTRNGVHRLLFQYNGKQHTYTVGEVPDDEALRWKSRTEQLLMRIKQGMLEVPRGVNISDFILHDGKPPGTRPRNSASAIATFTPRCSRQRSIMYLADGAMDDPHPEFKRWL
jgi:hypothetical protein